MIDLGLRLAVDDQRDTLVDREMRAAVEGREFLAVELEADGHHGPFLAARGAGALRRIAGGPRDTRVGEDRGVQSHGLLGLLVEPTG